MTIRILTLGYIKVSLLLLSFLLLEVKILERVAVSFLERRWFSAIIYTKLQGFAMDFKVSYPITLSSYYFQSFFSHG